MERGIANKLSTLLVQRGMTQKELAKVSNVTESAISHYIKGDRVPRGVNLRKIADALHTTVDYLLEDENCENGLKDDMELVKTLIARNASQMTQEEKLELLSILISKG